MSIGEVIVVELLKHLLNRTSASRHQAYDPTRLAPHLKEVVNWSSRIEFAGLAAARETDTDTVGLLMTIPRRLRGAAGNRTELPEATVLQTGRKLAVLGDPGAGKTTTLKRLTRVLLQEPSGGNDAPQYPLVIRLRELDDAWYLEEKLAEALDLRHARLKVPVPESSRPSDDIRVMIGIESAINVIATVADETAAAILLDGLDEVRPSLRNRTEVAIEELSRKCETACITITCRSADYRPMSSFDTLEICELHKKQIKEIIVRWCSQPQAFTAALEALPFRDLASRPLFLCELIVLFDKRGFLPKQPAAVYRRIVLLALEEWDKNKPVKRLSHYADFDPDRKLEFLANLAYHLTYVTQQKHFTPESLKRAYRVIRSNFALPEDDAQRLWSELETHTGLTVQAGFERYEFSHLSIQEFLSAYYLVRDNVTDDTVTQMSIAAAPFAISVAIAANPSRRLAAIILARWDQEVFRKFNMDAFFSRIALEYAAFGVEPELGFAALALLFNGHATKKAVAEFLKQDSVVLSIGEALLTYTAELKYEGTRELYNLRPFGVTVRGATVALHGRLPADFVNPIFARCNLHLDHDPVDYGMQTATADVRIVRY